MKRFRPSKTRPTLSLVAFVLATTGCSNPQEDVRVTLCKDIVSGQVGSSALVTRTETKTKGYEYASVRVIFSDQGRDGQAICYYDYKALDDTADMLADPLSAYATSPFEVRMDGKKLSKPALAEAIKQAMLGQGRELLDRAKKGIENAITR